MISFRQWCEQKQLAEAFDEPAAFGGLLVRWGKDTWAWKDGTRETRVQDFHPSWYYNFRVARHQTPHGQSAIFIEVPIGLIGKEYDLEWLREPLADARRAAQQPPIEPQFQPNAEYIFTVDFQKKPVLLVPAQIWDDWNARTVLGPKWEKKDEQAILAKAKSLGWQ